MVLNAHSIAWLLLAAAAVVALSFGLSAFRAYAHRRTARAQALWNCCDELFDHSPVAQMQVDRNGIVRRVNRRECDLRGVTSQQLLGRHFADLSPPASREQDRHELGRRLALQAPLVPYHRRIQRGGDVVTVEVHETLLCDSDGHVTGMHIASLDVTARKQAEEETAVTRREFRSVLAACSELFVRVNAAGEVLGCNGGGSGERLLDPQTFTGKRLNEVLPAEVAQRIVDAIGRVRTTNAPETLEYAIERADGRQSWECRLVPLYWDNVTAAFRNVTARKVADDKLEQLALDLKKKNEELETAVVTARDATRLKSRFLANMSHEIRTPMNGVLGMADLLLATAMTAEQRGYAESIRQSADALLCVVNDIVDLSKIEAGKMRLERTPFHLGVAVEEIAAAFTTRARAKELKFRVDIPSRMPYLAIGDPGRLRQVLINLLGNALKFTDQGEIGVQLEILAELKDEVRVRFTVHDTGIGISKQDQRELFRSFSQVDGSGTRRHGGAGLGLAISKEIVTLLSGQIGVTSEPGQGSRFWFTAVFGKQAAERLSRGDSANPSVRDVRVLVAAHAATSSVVMRLLEVWGCRTVELAGGQALTTSLRDAAAHGDPFRIALLDIDVPELNAVPAAGSIRRDPAIRDLLLVGMTSSPLAGDGNEVRQAGFAGYVRKPVQTLDLYNTLVEALRGAPPREKTTPAAVATRRILLAEDNQINQRIAMRLLEKLGLHADAVANGREAVEALSRAQYDLILMDCQMPEMDGYEATAAIRNKERNTRRTPICALTANAMDGDRERCLASGMDDYVSKPIALEKLRTVIERWVN